MRIFDANGKINFVDENNVFLGYDMQQDCCEYADWFIADERHNDIVERESEQENYAGWVFDIDFFESVENRESLEDGEMAIFRITKGEQEKFIHIFNAHNGYYGHGFSFGVGEEATKEAWL